MKKLLAFALCLSVALPAAAHPDHAGAGLLAGFAHPFTGFDHLLAMLGVGLWSRQQGRVALLPAFVLMMAAGALIQIDVPIEMGIAASVALIGALLAAAVRLPAAAALALVGAFAFLHGQAHGRELPQLASAAGFLLASGSLLLAGRALGSPTVGPGVSLMFSRVAGAAIGAAGLCLLAVTA